jgi:uroporphyrinogen-III synthase
MHTAFITRSLAKDSDFRNLLEKAGWVVNGQSFVKFEAIPFILPDPFAFDWVFFSSQQAVRFFFAQIPPTFFSVALPVRWAALGPGTARVLSGYTNCIDFVGTGDPAGTSLASGERVLFPGASQSLESVQQALKALVSATTLAIYHNTPIGDPALHTEQVLVFTSPMNVQAYCSKHALLPRQQCVAIGEATRLALHEQGIKNIITATEPTEKGLAEAVISNCAA